MNCYKEGINWKGIGDYLSAARSIAEHGTSNTVGPKIHCQGLALELALKYYLWDKDGCYPGTHDLEHLAFDRCREIDFSNEERAGIKDLNAQYKHDGEFAYPSRYRPNAMRVFSSPTRETLERVVVKIIRHTSDPAMAERILAR